LAAASYASSDTIQREAARSIGGASRRRPNEHLVRVGDELAKMRQRQLLGFCKQVWQQHCKTGTGARAQQRRCPRLRASHQPRENQR
jgi:hypothetical protein